MPWKAGDTVVLREIWRERIWTARPVTVVDDMPDQQIFYMSPGARWMCPRDDRGEWLRLPAEDWTLGERTLTTERVLSFAWPHVAYAVLLFWEDVTREFARWYVNLQEPLRRTGGGFDYLDHALDVVIAPDRSSFAWKDEDELRALANGVDYGLAAGIWSADTSKALRLAEDLEAGTVWINTYGMFDVAVPFGGRKHSGFGRELGEEALEPYLQSKSIWVDLTSAVPSAGQGISR